ncbi:hypothetical protein GGS21DRAFT_530595 [Xylaria nigripes]|nr:hypothetical protein GGS21DRAFT_530595 [Xylaria nigripes]
MLLPSAISPCDLSHPPSTRPQSSLIASPPASPTASSHTTFDTIVNSCRTLQSILTTAPTPAHPDLLPTPPLSHAPLPPVKMRLRSRPPNTNGSQTRRLKIRKRTTVPHRSVNKRRRLPGDDLDGEDDIDSDSDGNIEDAWQTTAAPSTPKRARIAPETLPRGLERADFHDLHEPTEEDKNKEGTEIEEEADGEPWSIEDDRVLVELIFEKLKLSRSEWQECARRVGKSENGAERRWKTLIRNGDIGVKARARRGKIHDTW